MGVQHKDTNYCTNYVYRRQRGGYSTKIPIEQGGIAQRYLNETRGESRVQPRHLLCTPLY